MTVRRIDHVGITVSDVDRAIGFYRDLLGMLVIGDSTVAEPERLAKAGATIVSRRPITISDPGGPFDGAICLYVRDPDGTVVELVQRRPD
jgi:catechol 2,3-dioxygenase-like lactoylglutathione lyase family enzyme